MPTWDADLYLRFADERARPARDLIVRIELPNPRRIVDLGCGPGNSTVLLHERWPDAELVGLDNSPEMIAAAKGAHPRWTWLQADISHWQADTPFDLVFSNAALHWTPDHSRLFPHLLRQASPSGVLAVQMPVISYSPVHQLIFAIADDAAWRSRMVHARTAIQVQSAGFYYDLLRPLSRRLDLWETEYLHVMDGPEAILEWIRGTGLRPFLEALQTQTERQEFLDRLLSGVAQAYPPQQDGRVLFPYRRLFLIACR